MSSALMMIMPGVPLRWMTVVPTQHGATVAMETVMMTLVFLWCTQEYPMTIVQNRVQVVGE